MKIIEKEFNIQTGEETITEREETAAEAKATAKAELLAKLGITAEEAALLLS